MSTSQEIDDAILLEEMINLETDQYLEMAAKNFTDIEWSLSPSVTNIQKPHDNKELAIKNIINNNNNHNHSDKNKYNNENRSNNKDQNININTNNNNDTWNKK